MFRNISRLFYALPSECKPSPPCHEPKQAKHCNLFEYKSLSDWQSGRFDGFLAHIVDEARKQEKPQDQPKIDVVLPPPMA